MPSVGNPSGTFPPQSPQRTPQRQSRGSEHFVPIRVHGCAFGVEGFGLEHWIFRSGMWPGWRLDSMAMAPLNFALALEKLNSAPPDATNSELPHRGSSGFSEPDTPCPLPRPQSIPHLNNPTLYLHICTIVQMCKFKALHLTPGMSQNSPQKSKSLTKP
jgi:hypothetical protein